MVGTRFLRIGLLLSIIFVSTKQLSAQVEFARSLTLGSSYTYIFDQQEVFTNTFVWYHEFTWNTNIALEVLPKWHLGFAYMNIHTRSTRPGSAKGNYNMFSAFSQYDLFWVKKWRWFVEANYSYGDYCTCGREDPYKVPGLHYLGIGAGAELPLYKRLRLDLAFNNYQILNDINRKYNYTQYIIGLNYRLGKPVD